MMVEMKSSTLKKPKAKEDKSHLLNSTVSSINSTDSSHNTTVTSEFEYEDRKKCSAWCWFISACLFIIYLFLVILLSWVLRAYIYKLLKRYLHIGSINELYLQPNQNTYSSINLPNTGYEIMKNKPESFDLNLYHLDDIVNGHNSLAQLELEKLEETIFHLDQNGAILGSGEEFMEESSGIIETDALTGIINNMSDLIMSELELVEKTLKSNVQKYGDSSINMNDIDIFSDHIISNITKILEEEIKFVEESLKTNKDLTTGKEFINKNVDYSGGLMGFLADIFEHNDEKKDSIKHYDVNQYSIEPRFGIMEPMPEPDSNHNNLEASEDLILNTAVDSIRNLFGIDKNKKYKESSDADRVVLETEQKHIDIKMLQEYLEIFGLVLAVMSLLTFILLFLIHHCLEMSDRRKVIMRYKLQENAKDDNRHVI